MQHAGAWTLGRRKHVAALRRRVPSQLAEGGWTAQRGLGRWRRRSTASGRQAWAPRVLVAGVWCLRTVLSGRLSSGLPLLGRRCPKHRALCTLLTGFFSCEFEIVSELKVKQITTRETALHLHVGCLAVGRKGVPMPPAPADGEPGPSPSERGASCFCPRPHPGRVGEVLLGGVLGARSRARGPGAAVGGAGSRDLLAAVHVPQTEAG